MSKSIYFQEQLLVYRLLNGKLWQSSFSLFCYVADEDFSDQITSIGFGLGKSPKQCTRIQIMDDYAVEDVEYLTAVMQTPYANIDVLTATANITIIPDDDSKQFENCLCLDIIIETHNNL